MAARAGAEIISAMTGDGLDRLKSTIDGRLTQSMEQACYRVGVQDGAALAWLYAHGEVVDRVDDKEVIRLTVRLLAADRARFERQQARNRQPGPVEECG